MVRKRSRKYDSDDNDSDSDVDFDFDQKSKAVPKRYSLRERKKASLTTDFDYYGLDEEDGEVKKQSSDDEDFEVEADVDINGARAYFEPDPDAIPENPEGLIDFEDIIRADIVVNRNKIDYDNIIQKTEIKLEQPKKRRGRPPKYRSSEQYVKEEISEPSNVSEGELSTSLPMESETKKTEPEIEISEKSESENAQKSQVEEGLPNGETTNGTDEKTDDKEPLVEDKTSKNVETVAVEPSPIENEIQEKITEEDEDDDVIVLGELKHDVIVLDD